MLTQEQNTNARFDCASQQSYLPLYNMKYLMHYILQYKLWFCQKIKKKINWFSVQVTKKQISAHWLMILHDLSCLKVHVRIDYCSVIRLWTQQSDADICLTFFFLNETFDLTKMIKVLWCAVKPHISHKSGKKNLVVNVVMWFCPCSMFAYRLHLTLTFDLLSYCFLSCGDGWIFVLCFIQFDARYFY